MPRAPKSLVLEWDEAGWDELLQGIVKGHLEPRAEKIANACNKAAEASSGTVKGTKSDRIASHSGPPAGKRDYMVSTEGSNPLRLNDYRATVITVSDRAKADNARNHTLVRNLHLGGG